VLSFSIAERGSETTSVRGPDAWTGLLIGGGVLGIALIVVGYAWRRTSLRKARGDAMRHTDDILRAIAELDDEHALGRIAEDEYQNQREKLKRRALDRMSMEDD